MPKQRYRFIAFSQRKLQHTTALMMRRIPTELCWDKPPTRTELTHLAHPVMEHSVLLTHGEVASPHLNNRTKLEVSAEQSVAHTLPKEVTMKYELTTATQCTQSAQWISKRCLWDCLLENCHSDHQRGRNVVVSQHKSDQEILFADPK